MPLRRHRWQYGSRHSFQFGPVLNSGLFSSHWLENRLCLEPEWRELREQAKECLSGLAALWRVQKTRVALYGDEDTLRRSFIDRVLELLGWKLKPEPLLQSREPDYALFADDAALDAALRAGRGSPEFWTHPLVVGEAKAWDVRLDRPTTVNGRREYPPEQIEWYLNHSQLDFGILTNGRLWRLVPRNYEVYHHRFEAFLEADLPKLLDGWLEGAGDFTKAEWYFEEFLPFYLFFGPSGFSTAHGRKPLAQRAIQGSSEYRLGIGEDLRERAFEALGLCVSGYLHYAPNQLNAAADMELCREHSLVFLYRLLFVMFAEDRGLLPYPTNDLYTNNRSLARHRDEVAGRIDRVIQTGTNDYSRTETAIWQDLQGLFDLIYRGHARYGVAPYNGGLFDPDERPFLSEKRVPDRWMARVIDHLSRAKDAKVPAAGLCRVDYRDLAIQHLGGVYEGLLEVHPRYAPEPMMVVRERTRERLVERTVPVSQGVPRGFEYTGTTYEAGAVYLETKKGERQASGSYYTPDHIVTHIVEQTLGPLCKAISDELDNEIAGAQRECDTDEESARAEAGHRLDSLKADYGRRVLRLRVLDPAMGSGHFLLRACRFLAEEIATHRYSGEPDGDGEADESTVTYWKRRVVECCLYGVDLNPMAVELAELALWLETVAVGRPLTFLAHHVRPGNSLIGARVAELGVLPGEIELRANELKRQLEEKLSLLLAPLEEIRVASSDRLEDVKSKDRLYRALERARRPFRDVADVWCSTFVETDDRVIEAQYQEVIDALGKPRRFAQLSDSEWFRQAARIARREDLRPFHWELEFPEVFFQEGGRRADAGFDAVLGNPPYDVLSERESGRDLAALRAFVDHEPVYRPSQRGKNNLYKLFICRALELLADGGYFSFITPMPVLGDDQAADLRREMVRQGTFTGIEAFPQKDDPRNRVFPEAKLSTAVFAMRKAAPRQGCEIPFRSRVHPGAVIDPGSPSLLLTTGQIPLYDPSNCGIVSCSQADWDLATRIMQTGRMARLRDSAEFFQGEVNETNERRRGTLAGGPEDGTLVNRGAGICLYVLRPESQGKDLYIDVDKFLAGKGETTKAFHHRQPRVGLQESCPQNNFRRIIAAFVPAGRFLNHKVNYCPERACKLDLRFLLALLNSKLADWYFRLGSTNASVSHYQLYNLPCPRFAEAHATKKGRDGKPTCRAVRAGDLAAAWQTIEPMLQDAPFPVEVQQAITAAVERIIAIEEARENMARKDRSALHPDAQPYQDFIDRLFYRMAGLTDAEAAGLEERLARML